ncbi:MAG TPA: hypothetical protein VE954_07550 [Oligoflexus sp.]|uniref:hypothetical protein n=1 Tax=Oligoflexus sp. TaxID=1971216 RepID=UPI002D6027D0|nr:hypothetical protein [Oligoflexus sp.]HYX32954.1 hypothetical protein [Oligoflexus sp.]
MSVAHSETGLSSTLLAAALAGLMGGGLVGCNKEDEKIVEVSAPAAAITSTTVDTTMTKATFSNLCETRGGVMQTHASCSGSNTCAGVSFHTSSGKLSEHTCKAANICGGMSCVDLPEDRGLTGAAILEGGSGVAMSDADIQCNFCHGEGKTAFILPIAPGADATAEAAAFQAQSDAAMVATIAFGIHGINADGSAFANMPGFYKTYSLPEMKRLVTHLRSLPLETKEWRETP